MPNTDTEEPYAEFSEPDLELVATKALANEILNRSDEGIIIRFRKSPGDKEPSFDILCTWDFHTLAQMCATAIGLLHQRYLDENGLST